MAQDASTSQPRAPSSTAVKAVLLAAVAALAVVYFRFAEVQAYLVSLLEWLRSLGAFGMLLFILLYVVSAVFLLPASVITLGAGAVYGVIAGTILVSISSTLGAGAAFLIGRYFARGRVSAWLANRERLREVDRSVGLEGWKIVVLTRLSPVFPYNVLNYFYGITKISFLQYFLASWIAMIPGTILYVYVGSLIGELTQIGAVEKPKSGYEWLLYGVGLAATVLVTVKITRIARNALSERITV